MTKLTELLTAVSVIIAVWLVLLKFSGDGIVSTYLVLPLPVHLIILFGIYSVTTVLYRTVNFKDCPEAAKELQQQIEEARRDLKSKGLKF